MNKIYLFSFFLVISALYGCASNKPKNNAVQDLIAAHKNQEKYRSVMNKFITYAKNKNINEMIALTSKITIKKNGISLLKKTYKNTIVPEIKSCKKLYTQKNITRASKKLTGIGSGYIYNKICQKGNGETSVINIAILKENDHISLASIFVFKAKKPNKQVKIVR